MVNYTVATEQRYTQVSSFLSFPGLEQALELLREAQQTAATYVTDEEQHIESSVAEEIVKTMDGTGIPHDAWSSYDWYQRQDLMCRSSFFTKKDHPVPKTGSRSTVPHYRIDLSKGRNWFVSQTKQGETCSIFNNSRGYFSHTKCIELAKQLEALLPGRVAIKFDINAEYPILVSFKFPEISLQTAIGIQGQGQVCYIPEILERVANGHVCLVRDNMYDRNRPGVITPDGHFWQA